MPQLHHQHRHDLTFFLFVVGASLLLYAFFGLLPALALPEPKLWAPIGISSGHWKQWLMASAAVLSPHTELASINAFVIGGLVYCWGLLVVVTPPLQRIDVHIGSAVRAVLIIFVYAVWPILLYGAVYTGFSFGYLMR